MREVANTRALTEVRCGFPLRCMLIATSFVAGCSIQTSVFRCRARGPGLNNPPPAGGGIPESLNLCRRKWTDAQGFMPSPALQAKSRILLASQTASEI